MLGMKGIAAADDGGWRLVRKRTSGAGADGAWSHDLSSGTDSGGGAYYNEDRSSADPDGRP
jgi:hypothetical protein